MPALDRYHEHVRNALVKDGWTITHDPLTIPYGKTEILVDIGAEQLLAAEREGRRIAVEIKSFIKPSLIQDLKEAIGIGIYTSLATAFQPAFRAHQSEITDRTRLEVPISVWYSLPVSLLAKRAITRMATSRGPFVGYF